jgi:Uma2 family endonuclease
MLVTLEDYHRMGEEGSLSKRTELLYGIVYEKPTKTPLQCFLINWLGENLRLAVPKDLLVRLDLPITCDDSEPEPDISVVRGSIRDYMRRHPETAELVIEVCVNSHKYDRSKLRTYARANVKECWLVLGPEKQIEVYSEPRDGRFVRRTVHEIGEVVTCVAVPEFSVNLQELFARGATI